MPRPERLRQEDYNKFEASLLTYEVPGQPEGHSEPLGVAWDILEEAALGLEYPTPNMITSGLHLSALGKEHKIPACPLSHHTTPSPGSESWGGDRPGFLEASPPVLGRDARDRREPPFLPSPFSTLSPYEEGQPWSYSHRC